MTNTKKVLQKSDDKNVEIGYIKLPCTEEFLPITKKRLQKCTSGFIIWKIIYDLFLSRAKRGIISPLKILFLNARNATYFSFWLDNRSPGEGIMNIVLHNSCLECRLTWIDIMFVVLRI